MTTITLPPDIETPLLEQAKRRGLTPEKLALDKLRQAFATPRYTPEELAEVYRQMAADEAREAEAEEWANATLSNTQSEGRYTWAQLQKACVRPLMAASLMNCSVEWAEAQLKREAKRAKQMKAQKRANL